MTITARRLRLLPIAVAVVTALLLGSSCSGSTSGASDKAAAPSPGPEAASTTSTRVQPPCDPAQLWATASSTLGLDPADPGYSMGPTPDVPSHRCVGDWAKGCAQRPLTGCTDIVDFWHWSDGAWTYVADIGIPPASCLMRDIGVSDAAISVFTENYDQLRDSNLCSYPPPAEVRDLISQEIRLDIRCRGTATELQSCEERNAIYQRIVALGWCYDDPSLIVAEWHWHRCGDSNSPIDWARYHVWFDAL